MELIERYAEVQERIAAAAAEAGRRAEDITLVAVTKSWPAGVVVEAYAAGLRHFGENRAEELAAKRPQVEAELPAASGIIWHAIGSLQSRKSNLVAEHADAFHALDREKIARRLSDRLLELGRAEQPLPIFIEVNVSGETNKAGLDCSRWESDLGQRQALRRLGKRLLELPGLRPVGLMTMAPWGGGEETLHALFGRTRQLAAWLSAELPDAPWSQLSMGMSDDYEIAIEEGASHVRVGRALFGERELTQPT
ncbi:MAG: YggS family pyridoxal phosphate-dependent enzyme [Candidatus Promineifilaceae bacterium]